MEGMGGMIGGIISGAENSMDRIGGTAFSHYWAKRNERFQYDQAATAYQRAVGDMRAAGLNPMLAYSQGGAHSAQGARASPSSGSRDPGSAFTSAAVAKQQIENMKQQNLMAAQQTRLATAEADKADVEKTIYRGLLPVADVLGKYISNWSAQSLKRSESVLEPRSLLDAARGKTTDLFEWIGDSLKGLSSKESWIRARDDLSKEVGK